MLELGHAQVGNRDEVLGVTEASGGGFGLLKQPVHCFAVGVATPVEHAADDAAEVFFQGGRQALEWLEPRTSRPAHPLRQCAQGDRFAVAVARLTVHQPQGLLESPGPRALQVRALKQVHRVELRAGPAHRVQAHTPQQLAKGLFAVDAHRLADRCRRAAHHFASHLVHRRVGQRHEVKAVVAELGVRQRLPDPLGVGCAHVDAGVFDHGRIAPVRTHVLGKGPQGLMVTTGAREQQTLGLEVMHDGDVLMTTLDAGLVDADVAHARHVVLGARHLDVVAKPLPSRAHGTGNCVVLPQPLHCTRGTSACNHASNWKKSR